jgi:hypothetical protein
VHPACARPVRLAEDEVPAAGPELKRDDVLA